MRYDSIRFKSPQLALKELAPFIRDGEHLQTGRPFASFGGLRSREMLANWLLCEAVNSTTSPGRLTFAGTHDPTGGDGVIFDTVTGSGIPTEHVLVPRQEGGPDVDIEQAILTKIEQKHLKGGTAYGSGKTLVVFREAAGKPWLPKRVAEQLPQDLAFEAVWVVGLQLVDDGSYVYDVTRLDLSLGAPPVWSIRIAPDFTAWQVAS